MLLLLLSLVSLFKCQTTFYYVDCDDGDDSKSGNSPTDAWLTLQPVRDHDDFVAAGETFLLKRGCVWHEDIAWALIEGTESQPVVFSDYGDENEELPTLDGSVLIDQSEWTHDDGDIYYADIDDDIKEVYFGDAPLNVSHYPHGAPHNCFYITTSSSGSTVHVPDDFLAQLSNSEIIDSTIIIRHLHWGFASATVLSVDRIGKTIDISLSGDYPNEFGFFLMNKRSFMTEESMWFHDTNIQRLYVWLPGGVNPAQSSIHVRYHVPGRIMNFWGVTHLTLRSLRIVHSHDYCLFLGDATYVLVENLQFEWCEYGIAMMGGNSHDVVVTQNTILHSLRRGIMMLSDAYSWTDCEITYNLVDGSGDFGGLTRFILPEGTDSGPFYLVKFEGSRQFVAYNELTHSGGGGFSFGGRDCVIEKNFVHDIGYLHDDSGLIYVYNGSYHQIRENLLLRGYGNVLMTDEHDDPDGYAPMNGIYTDDLSSYNTIEDNLIVDVYYGIHSYNSKGNIIRNNVVFATRATAMFIAEGGGLTRFGKGAGWCTGHVVTGNVFHSVAKQNGAVRIWGDYGVVDHMITSFDDNLYYTYGGGYRQWAWVNAVGVSSTYYEFFEEWAEVTPYDDNSAILGETFYIPLKERIVGKPNAPELVVDGNFDSGTIDGWGAWDSMLFDLSYDATRGGENLGCLKSEFIGDPEAGWFQALGDSWEIAENITYLVKAKVALSPNGDRIAVGVRMNSGSYDGISGKPFFVGGGDDMKDVSFAFVSPISYDEVRVEFESGEHGLASTMFVDDVSVVQIESVEKIDGSQSDFGVVFNTDVVTKDIELDIPVCDLDGNTVKGSVTLGPRRGMIFVNCFCNYDGVCNNRETKRTCPDDCGEEKWYTKDWAIVLFAVAGTIGLLICVAAMVAVVVIVVCVVKAKGTDAKYDQFSSNTEMRNQK